MTVTYNHISTTARSWTRCTADSQERGWLDEYSKDGKVIIGEGDTATLGITPLQEGDDCVRDISAPTVIHDLQGRRLAAPPTHGLYIQNGRKYIGHPI